EWEHCFVVYPMGSKSVHELRPYEFIGIRPHEAAKLATSELKRFQEKLVIQHPVTYRNRSGYNLHRLLRAVDINTVLSKITESDVAAKDEFMVPMGKLVEKYAGLPKVISNTVRLLEQCETDFDLDSGKNRISFTSAKRDDKILLEKLALDGFKYRYSENNKTAFERLQKELKMIHQLNFSGYFLITWDIVRYAQSRAFRHVGRGSGANSIVAYCLGITDVDPIELDLYFERFINPQRSSPPDFDIDFSWDERDEVTDYIFKRYGKKYTALLATYNTFKGKSIIRELGKVFGLPKAEIDKLVVDPNNAKLHDNITTLIFRYGKMMEKFPNHLSIHAGGVLISENPIYEYTATEMPPKGFPITQFDMFVAEDIGFYKYDILSQRGLGHMKEAVQIIYENRNEKVDIDAVNDFKKDKKINKQLESGDTVGCFYIESPAMRQLIKKLDCDNYLTLVAASSIIRPGVAKSGMMREYIQRHHNPDSFEYIHPKMKEIIHDTYGVMVYQEDVIKVAHHFADLDLGEADILRRAMSGKYRNKDGFKKIEDKFFENCDKRGYPRKISAEVWRQMESFSGYSFSKAHSASFAVESYQSLFLKTYYPKEFMVAVINNFGGFYRTELYVNEAVNAGAKIEAPCVNNSRYLTSIKGETIYLGFVHVKDLERQLAKRIVSERLRNGNYAGLVDLTERVPISPEQLNTLIRVGALRFIGKTKKELLWEANMLVKKRPAYAETDSMFKLPVKEFQLPELKDHWLEDTYDEMELIGFPLRNPFDLLKTKITDTLTSEELGQFTNKTVKIVGYLVCTKSVRTVSGKIMFFGTYADRNRKLFDTVHFPPSLEKYPLRGRGIYMMEGKVIDDFGVSTLEVKRMWKLAYMPDPRYGE
ncbi:MAG: DNA polymerase III subunit alpha, partial [Chitinophagales bacterium]|nr:DNA polymerase III subunit alpha [Chitinophagales bacterium]